LKRQDGEKDLKKQADEERRAQNKDAPAGEDVDTDDDDDAGLDDLDLDDDSDVAVNAEEAASNHDEL